MNQVEKLVLDGAIADGLTVEELAVAYRTMTQEALKQLVDAHKRIDAQQRTIDALRSQLRSALGFETLYATEDPEPERAPVDPRPLSQVIADVYPGPQPDPEQ